MKYLLACVFLVFLLLAFVAGRQTGKKDCVMLWATADRLVDDFVHQEGFANKTSFGREWDGSLRPGESIGFTIAIPIDFDDHDTIIWGNAGYVYRAEVQ